jgi:hypothetical protein
LFEALEPRLLLSADLIPVAPIGTMVHAAHEAGVFAAPGMDVAYTLSLDAGQNVSIASFTQDADLQLRLRFLSPDAQLIGEVSAAAAGATVQLDSLTAADAGDYSVIVHNLAGEGDFEVDFVLNATLEAEPVGATNNDVASAQDLAPSEIALPGGGYRYAAVGAAEA